MNERRVTFKQWEKAWEGQWVAVEMPAFKNKLKQEWATKTTTAAKCSATHVRSCSCRGRLIQKQNSFTFTKHTYTCKVREHKARESARESDSQRAKKFKLPVFYSYLFRNYFSSLVFSFLFFANVFAAVSKKQETLTRTHAIRGQINKQHTDCLHFLMRQRRALTRCPFVASQAPCTHTHTQRWTQTLWQTQHRTRWGNKSNWGNEFNWAQQRLPKAQENSSPKKLCSERERESVREQNSENAWPEWA